MEAMGGYRGLRYEHGPRVGPQMEWELGVGL